MQIINQKIIDPNGRPTDYQHYYFFALNFLFNEQAPTKKSRVSKIRIISYRFQINNGVSIKNTSYNINQSKQLIYSLGNVICCAGIKSPFASTKNDMGCSGSLMISNNVNPQGFQKFSSTCP